MFEIAHLSLVVSDMERSVNYYTSRLGFVETGRSENDRLCLCTLAKDKLQLELLCYRDESASQRAGSFDHIAFCCSNLEAGSQALLQKGVIVTPPEIISSPDGRRLFFASGPDGERLEFLERYPAALHPVETALLERGMAFAEAWRHLEEKQTRLRIHDFRVAVRRLDTVTTYCQDILKDKTLLRRQKKLNRLFHIMGRIRDCQVELDFLQHTDETLLDSRPLITALEKEEQVLLRKLNRRIATAAVGSYIRRLHKYQGRLHAAVCSLQDPRALEAALSLRYEKYLQQMRERRMLVQSGLPSGVHRFRIAAKKVRYSIEALHTCLGLEQNNVDLLRELQDLAGRIQDMSALTVRIEQCESIKAGTRQLMLNLLTEQIARLIDELQQTLDKPEYAVFWSAAETAAEVN